MERYFGEDDSEGLPAAKQIQREAFSKPDFRADEFLTAYHRFQTLDDLQAQLRKWAQVLGQELVDAINEDYGAFLDLGNQLSGGEDRVQDVKIQIQSFQKETTKVKSSLDRNRDEMDKLLDEKRRVVGLQNRARGLLLFHNRLCDLEAQLEQEESENIETLAKSYLTLAKTADRLKHKEQFIGSRMDRLSIARTKILQRLQQRQKESTDSDERLRLLLFYQEIKS
ncbi:hypothetical protein TRICI_003594 [Trichomonascus ciferrii]|uniref:Conserved oligomeric Golgi complex subunit 2 n=1 Tax=Trichomonascus ciferrii TaxID=44093 RepID=A0A642V8G2_9ASCO|nr:hypothetical protein TRICI_003594 [Trichomonascus ciferrii]